MQSHIACLRQNRKHATATEGGVLLPLLLIVYMVLLPCACFCFYFLHFLCFLVQVALGHSMTGLGWHTV